jgi:hypothetical protein
VAADGRCRSPDHAQVGATGPTLIAADPIHGGRSHVHHPLQRAAGLVHAALDRAVGAAYGWDDPEPAAVAEDELQARLPALNVARSSLEPAGECRRLLIARPSSIPSSGRIFGPAAGGWLPDDDALLRR